jgi:hypothetical protein
MVQLPQLSIVPLPEPGTQRICPTSKLVHSELIAGLAVMMADPVIPNFAPIKLQVSPLTTVYFSAHDPSGIQRIRPTCKLVHPELMIGLADIMSDPVTLNSAPISLQVSLLEATICFSMHDLSGIHRI